MIPIARAARVCALSLLLLLMAGGLAQPASALPVGILTLTPSSGPAGTEVTVNGSAFGANETVRIAFNGVPVTTGTTDNTGTFTASFAVAAVAGGSYPVTAAGQTSGRTGSKSFFVTAGTGTTLSVRKSVTVNGLGYGVDKTARPGDRVTYAIAVRNNTSTPATNVVVTDVLQPGQTVVTATLQACSYNPAARTVTCTIPSIAGGDTAYISIAGAVNQNFNGVLVNEAQASASNAPPAESNETTVTVGVTPVSIGTLTLCGPVTNATSSYVTIAGVTLQYGQAPLVTGAPITVGSNLCFTMTLGAANQIVALNVTPNFPGVSYVCGVATDVSSASLEVNGIPFPVASQVVFPFTVVVGQAYCLLLTPSGTVIGVLSNVTTGVVPVTPHDRTLRRVGHRMA